MDVKHEDILDKMADELAQLPAGDFLRVIGLLQLCASKAKDLRKERDSLEAQIKETYTDEAGTVWTRPTAYAYAQVCKARDKWQQKAGSYDETLEKIVNIACQRNIGPIKRVLMITEAVKEVKP